VSEMEVHGAARAGCHVGVGGSPEMWKEGLRCDLVRTVLTGEGEIFRVRGGLTGQGLRPRQALLAREMVRCRVRLQCPRVTGRGQA
jgi:hypothetical protein